MFEHPSSSRAKQGWECKKDAEPNGSNIISTLRNRAAQPKHQSAVQRGDTKNGDAGSLGDQKENPLLWFGLPCPHLKKAQKNFQNGETEN